jgi:hypothetical protein
MRAIDKAPFKADTEELEDEKEIGVLEFVDKLGCFLVSAFLGPGQTSFIKSA